MKEMFYDYLDAKRVLGFLVCQFYDYDFTMEQADELNIKYTNFDIFNSLNYVTCVFHQYTPDGLYIWNKLNMTQSIMTLNEMWDYVATIKNEEYNQEINYEKELLEIEMVILHIIRRHYSYEMTLEEAIKNNIPYTDYDEDEGNIEGIDHIFESAGENAWNLFGFENDFIPMSQVNDLEDELCQKLLKNEVRS